MAQQEVLEYLLKHKGQWKTSNQIAKATKQSRGSTSCNLRALIKGRFITVKDQGYPRRYFYMVPERNFELEDLK